MRSEKEMMCLILNAAREDERIRAVIMNGSRVNPNVKRDCFQDYDIVYVVKDIQSFTSDHSWINRFGKIMIVQMPERKHFSSTRRGWKLSLFDAVYRRESNRFDFSFSRINT